MSKILHTKWGNANIYGGYYVITSNKKGYLHKKLHRLIYEEFWGVKLPSEIIIHHKDGNKTNNCILNLEAMYRSDHISMHGKGNANMLGKTHSEETKQKIANSHKGIPLNDSTKKELSIKKNNTGYFRVSKRKRDNKQGFSWRYRVYDSGKEICIESIDLDTLKQKVWMNMT